MSQLVYGVNEMDRSKNVCVVVLGDIGRSPRMQYHSLSLAEQGHKVDVVCYQETRPMDSLTAQPLVSFHFLAPYPTFPCPRIINYAFKTIWQAVTLLFVLLITRKPHYLLVQNPPAVPALFVCWFFCLVTNAKYIIDWHNYAHTIMGLSLGRGHLLTKVTKKIEEFIGKRSHANFCVTNAMRKDLGDNWGISAVTLYDKPPEIFRPISLQEKHDFMNCLAMKYDQFSGGDSNTRFTQVDDGGKIALKANRPGLLVSSTSWTEDEDFSMLLESLQDYEKHRESGNARQLPDLICVVTGRGPLKQYYCDKIKAARWKHVEVITPWLEANDYPVLLASADLGVSLHTSSSGLDLPMKVVDMFGCGLPVCAYDFKSLHELVRHRENGFTFRNSTELTRQMLDWFEDFPKGVLRNELSGKFQDDLRNFQEVRWRENWKSVACNVFE